MISLLPSGPEQEEVLLKRSSIKSQIDDAISSTRSNVSPRAVASESPSASPSGHVDRSPGYLGEVSDIRFVNLVKKILQTQGGTAMTQRDFESYDQGESLVFSDKVTSPTLLLPVFEEAKRYINAYFTTIHIAYPFIPESIFVQEYKTHRDHDTPQARNCGSNIETALLCKLCLLKLFPSLRLILQIRFVPLVLIIQLYLARIMA